MEYTKEMKDIAIALNQEWKHEGDEYYSLIRTIDGKTMCLVAIPQDHRLADAGFDMNVTTKLKIMAVDVGVFGWIYERTTEAINNKEEIKRDIIAVIEYFKEEALYEIVGVATDDEWDEVYYEKVYIGDD